MYAISIKDEELLPLSKQMDLFEGHCQQSGLCANEGEFERIKKQLNRDFTRKVITLADFITLSLRLSKYSANPLNH
ncbi:hypothetical protein DRW07_13810 [Alteromonas sediminis]|uniref:Uncharacterized protein n=1 Tax=Alteromonas sediminis TaxID=2259342 RepID=A0A3N5XY84_9ALTE|nr:hypothetical protein [Alteromonas sediminis]RPJ65882.1 hypothetical protein DRW07_13810 [Alteromonas sediminis]